ncbi:hypothetical protein HanXRQr2_Chr03g0103361 [Helianthus annuus]|uniref:Uncharacterized protein n=1 Tax=Helianthus annuus TaxID=4232 RepID=A0A9K3NUJ9_HELAN|nr:hypothetical protein HanXRQr2_Chr03g0103361 [Helianthus annuus]KAJ0943089.1 hypothetical protein HanPSC8_Chr03g0099851 [Helianthus annuus]
MFKLLLGMSYFFMIYGNKLVAFFLYEVLHADGDEELLNLVCFARIDVDRRNRDTLDLEELTE